MTRALGFDPLIEFYGMWSTGLAERYLPLPYAPMVGKYEGQDGYLIKISFDPVVLLEP
ncbi:hypothetical protein KIPE111705_16170 [Kibdelosporangium persicum]|uniref:hypothetical protein n=1 Tax=Kibdelosporangium persicum TaxID=2698649 RepID=UPI0015638801|nr:hypothetical protein [Kibdelosporangium persicum]